jgi:hypothetical protein
MTVVRVRGEAATANKERRKERQRVGIVGCSMSHSSRFTMLAIALSWLLLIAMMM